MSKKQLNTGAISNELEGASLFFAKPNTPPSPLDITPPLETINKDEVALVPTPQPTQPREPLRQPSSEYPRGLSRDLPSRDDVQGFSFRLRDELKVKVQAEVPHHWQDRLEDIARQLNVKKLELYRFIIGDFLGEVKQPGSS